MNRREQKRLDQTKLDKAKEKFFRDGGKITRLPDQEAVRDNIIWDNPWAENLGAGRNMPFIESDLFRHGRRCRGYQGDYAPKALEEVDYLEES